MTRYIVATTNQVPPGERMIVQVGGREVGIFNVRGQYYAMRNRCPHQAGPVCLGHQLGSLSSTAPGDYQFVDDGMMIRCPWHQWEFDLRTGQSWFDPLRVRTRGYSVSVEPGSTLAPVIDGNGDGDGDGDGKAGTEVAGPDGSGARSRRQPGPYVAEVYPVTVEHDYIVVDVGR